MKLTIITLASIAAFAGSVNAQTYNVDFLQSITAGGHDVLGDGSLIASLAVTQSSNPTGQGQMSDISTSRKGNYFVSSDNGVFDFTLSYSGSNASGVTATHITFYGQSNLDFNSNGIGDEYAKIDNNGVWYMLQGDGVKSASDPSIAWGTANNNMIGIAVWGDSATLDWSLHNEAPSSIESYFAQGFQDIKVFVTPVPEPSSTTLLGLGALGLLARRKR